jgi:hypothetical protein
VLALAGSAAMQVELNKAVMQIPTAGKNRMTILSDYFVKLLAKY